MLVKALQNTVHQTARTQLAGIFSINSSRFQMSNTSLIVFVGPIVGALINKYGCRVVGIAGSLTLTTSFILSIFSPNIEMMIVTYGLIGG